MVTVYKGGKPIQAAISFVGRNGREVAGTETGSDGSSGFINNMPEGLYLVRIRYGDKSKEYRAVLVGRQTNHLFFDLDSDLYQQF